MDLLSQTKLCDMTHVRCNDVAELIRVLEKLHKQRLVLYDPKLGEIYSKLALDVVIWLLSNLKDPRLRIDTLHLLSESLHFSHTVNLGAYEDQLIDVISSMTDESEIQRFKRLIDTHWWSVSYLLRACTNKRISELSQSQTFS